jgi:hypothetical protein
LERSKDFSLNSYIGKNDIMASTIKIKRSSVPSKVPTTSDIATGELAINTKDRKIYSSNGTSVFSFTSDYLQVANANALISAGGATWAALTSTNTAIRLLVSDRLQVANAASIYATQISPTTSGVLAHTGRATISTNLIVSGNTVIGKLVANGSLGTAGYALKTNGTTVYWDSVGGGGGSTTQYLQVANAVAIYQTKAVERAALANTNLAITNVNTGLTSTNTAIRLLVSDRLQVANASTLYVTKSNPATSGLLAHTGRATISTNLGVTGNTSIGGSLVVTGDLTINGTTTTLNSTTVSVDDINIILGDTASPTNASADGGGITLKGATDKTFNWVNATNAWTSSENLNLASGKSMYLNGTDFQATYAANSYVKSTLANTNTYIATKLSSSNPTTSGLLAHTGRATISTNLTVSGNTSITGVTTLGNGAILGTPASGNLSTCTADGTDQVGFKNIPQNSQSADYTCVLADAGKHIFHPSADANARTFTIPANSSVAYPIGTAITFVNMTAAVVTIAITTDTMYLSSAGTTGSRSLAQYGSATALKLTTTTWLISGSGLT